MPALPTNDTVSGEIPDDNLVPVFDPASDTPKMQAYSALKSDILADAPAGTQRSRQDTIDLLTQDGAGDIDFSRDGSGAGSDLRGQIRANAVDATAINNSAVSTDKIQNLAVTNGKLATNAVTALKINDSSVSEPKLATTGTPSETTFLRGDMSWSTPPTGDGGGTARSREATVDLLVGDSAGDVNFTRDGSGDSSDLRGTIRNDSVTSQKLSPLVRGDLLRIPDASPGNNLVWKTDGSGDPAWRADAQGSASTPATNVAPEDVVLAAVSVPGSASATSAQINLSATSLGTIITTEALGAFTAQPGRYIVQVTGNLSDRSSNAYRAYPQFIFRNRTATTVLMATTPAYFRGTDGDADFTLFGFIDLAAATELVPGFRRQEYDSGQSDAAFTVSAGCVVKLIPVGGTKGDTGAAGADGISVTLTQVANAAAAGSTTGVIYFWPAA